MANINITEISKNIFESSEDSIYDILEKFEKNQNIDKSLTYVYIKAFYIHSVNLYLKSKNKLEYFEEIYVEYKNNLLEYYKINNSQISEELIKDISEVFDKTFEMLETMGFKDIDDSYEFRHYTILCFDLLRNILEKKSKSQIRIDIFENYISKFRDKAEDIINYIAKNIK